MYFVPLCPSKRIAHALARADQPAIGRLDQVLVLGGEFAAAHFAALDRRALAGKLPKRRKRAFLLRWKRGSHVSHRSAEFAPTDKAAMDSPLSSCATDTNPDRVSSAPVSSTTIDVASGAASCMAASRVDFTERSRGTAAVGL